jgi:hypothetical protein
LGLWKREGMRGRRRGSLDVCADCVAFWWPLAPYLSAGRRFGAVWLAGAGG